jgi:hypothetical protein
MKTLRIARNIAALFILVMALLFFWPSVQPLRADQYTYCGYKKGSDYCLIDATTGACIGDVECLAGQPCPNQGCTNHPPKCKSGFC